MTHNDKTDFQSNKTKRKNFSISPEKQKDEGMKKPWNEKHDQYLINNFSHKEKSEQQEKKKTFHFVKKPRKKESLETSLKVVFLFSYFFILIK
jgi:hypothetical protein